MGRIRSLAQYVRAMKFMRLDASRLALPIRRRARISRLANPSAIYIGTMPGFGTLPPLDLYNLLVQVGDHPVGSTVSRATLERHGVPVPVILARSFDGSEFLNRRAVPQAQAA